jgi:hypothetical protein
VNFGPVSSHWNPLDGKCVEIQGTDAETWELRDPSDSEHPVTTSAFAMTISMPESTFYGAQELKRDIATRIRMPNYVEEDMEKTIRSSNFSSVINVYSTLGNICFYLQVISLGLEFGIARWYPNFSESETVSQCHTRGMFTGADSSIRIQMSGSSSTLLASPISGECRISGI